MCYSDGRVVFKIRTDQVVFYLSFNCHFYMFRVGVVRNFRE